MSRTFEKLDPHWMKVTETKEESYNQSIQDLLDRKGRLLEQLKEVEGLISAWNNLNNQ